jgi:hypothetical protein
MLRKVSGAFVKNIAESNAYSFIRRRPSVRQNNSTLQRWFPLYTAMNSCCQWMEWGELLVMKLSRMMLASVELNKNNFNKICLFSVIFPVNCGFFFFLLLLLLNLRLWYFTLPSFQTTPLSTRFHKTQVYHQLFGSLSWVGYVSPLVSSQRQAAYCDFSSTFDLVLYINLVLLVLEMLKIVVSVANQHIFVC